MADDRLFLVHNDCGGGICLARTAGGHIAEGKIFWGGEHGTGYDGHPLDDFLEYHATNCEHGLGWNYHDMTGMFSVMTEAEGWPKAVWPNTVPAEED